MFPARRRRKTIWQMFARPQKRIFSKGIQGPLEGRIFSKASWGKSLPRGKKSPVGGEKHWVRMKFDVFLSKTDCLKIMFYLSKLVKLQKLWWKKFPGSYSFQFLIFFCIFCWISLKNFSNLSWSSRKKCFVSNKRCFCNNLVSAELSIFKNGHFQPCPEINIAVRTSPHGILESFVKNYFHKVIMFLMVVLVKMLMIYQLLFQHGINFIVLMHNNVQIIRHLIIFTSCH